TPSRPVDHLTPRRPPQGRLRRRYAMSYRSPLTRPPRSTASARTKGDGRMLVANPVLLKETVDLDRCTMGEHHRHPIDACHSYRHRSRVVPGYEVTKRSTRR